MSGIVHLSHISTGLRTGRRLGQFRDVRITMSQELPMQVNLDLVAERENLFGVHCFVLHFSLGSWQIDGEPWLQQPCSITVRLNEQVRISCY